MNTNRPVPVARKSRRVSSSGFIAHLPLAGAAASWMAATMRTCAPQRHRLSSMASTICASRRPRRLEQQRVGVEDHARRAVAALVGVVFEKGFLDGMEPAILAQPLDGQHLLAGHVLDRRGAGADRLAYRR